MSNPLKDHLTISPATSYDENSENINELNKPVFNRKTKNLVAIKTRGVTHRNRNEFGISPVSHTSPTASAFGGKEYETITSILAAAAYMGSGDASSNDSSNMDSPASVEYSYASLKERISSTRKHASTEQSPDSLRSLPYGSSHSSPEELKNTVFSSSSAVPTSSSFQRDSPASIDSSYASLKERITSACKTVMAEQSPDSLQSSTYGSTTGSPDILQNSVFFASTTPCQDDEPATSPRFSLNSFTSQDSGNRNTVDVASKVTSSSKLTSLLSSGKSRLVIGRAAANENVSGQMRQNDPSPSAQTAESIITTWSVDGISPTYADLHTVDKTDNVDKGKTVHKSHSNKLLVDDEGSNDFELLDFNSQETYEEIMMQEMRYPKIVEVAGKQDIKTWVAKSEVTLASNSKTKPKQVTKPPHRELPPPSPRPSPRIALNDQVLQTGFDFHSPLFLQEDSPLALSIPLPQKSVSFVTDRNAKDESKQDGTCLLKAVASPVISISQLRSVLSSHAACQKDSLGRYPLHILSSNYDLVLPLLQSTQCMRQINTDEDSLRLNMNRINSIMKNNRLTGLAQLEEFIFELIRLNPKALITPDSNGMIPFTAPLYEWIQKCNRCIDRQCMVDVNPSKVFNKELDDSGLSTAEVNVDTRSDLEHGFVRTAILGNLNSSLYPMQSDDMSTRSKQSLMMKMSVFNRRWYQSMKTPYKKNTKNENPAQEDNLSNLALSLGNKVFLNTEEQSNGCMRVAQDISFHVEWCLYILGRMLSLFADLNIDFDNDDELHNLLVPYPSNAIGFKAKFVSIISSIPSLMKILILKTDAFVLHADWSCSPIFDALLQDSVGDWIVFMLEDFDRNVVSRCVDYLECLSSRFDFPSNCEQSNALRNDDKTMHILHKISHLNFLLPATLSIETLDVIQRAVQTGAIQLSMDEELRMPMSMMIVLLDFVFRVLLIISFQLLSNEFISYGVHNLTYIVSFYLSLASIFYGLFRILSRMISTIKISFATYMKTFDGFYDWTERVAMAMALTAIIWIDKVQSHTPTDALRYFICITTLCLWARVLSWFHVVNPTATLFFRSVGKILLDLRWLWISLISVVLAFSQVFYISLSKPGPCLNKHGFCNPEDVYLQSYSILLGNFNLLEFPTAFTKFLFVSFSIIVCILLFNVLIGMTVHSIHKSMENAKAMATHISRLSYVTDVRAVRRLLTTRWTIVKSMSLGLFIICSVFLFYTSSSSTRILIAKAFDKQILLASIIALISIALLACTVFLAQISFIDPIEEPMIEPKDGHWFSRCVRTLLNPLRVAILSLVGTTKDPQLWLQESIVKSKIGGEQVSGAVREDEILHMHTATNEKLDKLYEMLMSLQAKDIKL